MAETVKRQIKTAKNTDATSETNTAVKEEAFTRADVEKMIAEAVKNAIGAIPTSPQVVTVTQEVPQVTLLFECDCAPDCVTLFGEKGKYGKMTGSHGIFKVAKDAFFGEFRDSLAQNLLASRELIVTDGLTDEERETYGVKYADGEFIEPKVWNKLLDMGDKLISAYPALCPAYKDMVVRKLTEAYQSGDSRVYRSFIVRLNEASKTKDGEDIKGAFINIIEAMNKKDMGE